MERTQIVVTDEGIERITATEYADMYTKEMLLPKQIFIEAYKKWILKDGCKIDIPDDVYDAYKKAAQWFVRE